jgi:hypothetical protein
MAYFIFSKNLDNIPNTLYRIASNQSDLNNLNIDQSIYKIIEDNDSNFNSVKFYLKMVLKYNQNNITYVDINPGFKVKEELNGYLSNTKNQITLFLTNNPNHPLFNLWNDYLIQLNSLNLNNISFPLNKSLEKYFDDLGQTSLNPLQLP